MKPHALRSGLWLANLALAAAVIGIGAWYALEVRPAVAEAVKKRAGKKRPKHLEALRSDYEKMRVTGLKWKPQPPVSDPDLDATILRADYKKKSPTHWIFSGPLPPEAVKSEKKEPTGPPPPKGLDTLGKLSTVIIDPPDSTILFKFAGGKSRAFGVGDFVKLNSKTDADRFRITKILEPQPRVYEVHYDVFGKDADKAERSDVLRYDRTGSSEGYPEFLRPDSPPKAAPAAGAGGAVDAVPAGTAPGATPETADGTQPDGTQPDGTPEVVRPIRKPTAELTLEDLKPEIIRNPKNANQRAIVFDDNTYRYFKKRDAKSVAGTVKTQVAIDKTTGRTIGLRITGFEDKAPSGVFDVRKGDILVSINGQKVKSRGDAVRIAESLKNATVVTVVIDRRGKLVTYRVDPQDPRNRRKVRYFEGFAN